MRCDIWDGVQMCSRLMFAQPCEEVPVALACQRRPQRKHREEQQQCRRAQQCRVVVECRDDEKPVYRRTSRRRKHVYCHCHRHRHRHRHRHCHYHNHNHYHQHNHYHKYNCRNRRIKPHEKGDKKNAGKQKQKRDKCDRRKPRKAHGEKYNEKMAGAMCDEDVKFGVSPSGKPHLEWRRDCGVGMGNETRSGSSSCSSSLSSSHPSCASSSSYSSSSSSKSTSSASRCVSAEDIAKLFDGGVWNEDFYNLRKECSNRRRRNKGKTYIDCTHVVTPFLSQNTSRKKRPSAAFWHYLTPQNERKRDCDGRRRALAAADGYVINSQCTLQGNNGGS